MLGCPMNLPRRRLPALVVLVLTVVLGAGCTSAAPSGDAVPSDADDDAAPATSDQDLTFAGPTDGELINAEGLDDLTFAVTAADTVDDVALLLNGDDVTTDVQTTADTLTYTPGTLPDGEHTVAVADAASPDDDAAVEASVLHTWSFEVDAEPPTIEVTAPEGAITADTDVTVAGTTEPGATVSVGGDQTTADESGAFELPLTADTGGEFTIVATDVAGNSTSVTERLAVVASRVAVDEIRTVHAASWAWANPGLREPILQMLDDGKINTVQLDLKDEAGHLGYDSEVPLAQEIGAVKGPLDLEATVADLHDRGVPVIGRIVAFADPTLASWAWANDQRDWVIQLPDGSDFYRGSYDGFSNYTHDGVIDYNLDIAEEAAQAGVDHILWDYIRRPEGIDNYTVPGLTGTPEAAIADFARRADERLAPYGVQHGASVYGIAADRPTQIGQDIRAMAEHLDYVAPMLYPSHWGPYEYGVADPNRQPYDIISESLKVWNDTVADRRARVVPWLEDTPYKAWDRPFQIREQIRAAEDHGTGEWLMWNPGSNFTPSAYDAQN